MKTFKLSIHPLLQDVTFSVKNGAAFQRNLIDGSRLIETEIFVDERDLQRVKKFAIQHGSDKSSNHGNWYAYCNGYAMGLLVSNGGRRITITTYRPYGKFGPVQMFYKDVVDTTLRKDTFKKIQSLGLAY